MNVPLTVALGCTLAFAAANEGIAIAADAPIPAVSFDQITVLYFGSSGTPAAPGTFATLRDGIGAAAASATAYPPIGGQATPNLDTIGAMSRGVLLHESFLGRLSRTDDPATMRATIARPDRNEVIYLDVAAKTYHIVADDAAKALLDPAPAPSMPATAVLPSPLASGFPPAAPAIETITMTHTAKAIDGMQIDGIATAGTVTDTTIAGSTRSPACPPIDSHMTVTRYVDPTRIEPKARFDFSGASAMLKSLPSLACTFVPGPAAPPYAEPSPLDRAFALYMRADSHLTVPALSSPFTTTMVVERANVKTLSQRDATLFDVPAGFTQLDPLP